MHEPFNARTGHYSGWHSFGHNSPAAAAREVFKPSTDSASRLVPSQKNIFQFWVWGCLGGHHKWRCFSIFMAYFTWTWKPIEWPKYFLETRLSYEFLDPLIGFLAYLDQKLCQKKQKVVKISIPEKNN